MTSHSRFGRPAAPVQLEQAVLGTAELEEPGRQRRRNRPSSASCIHAPWGVHEGCTR